MTTNPVKSYLAEHPKACGVVFMMMMLLGSAGNAVAQVSAATAGP